MNEFRMCLAFLTTPFMSMDDTVHRLVFFSFNFFVRFPMVDGIESKLILIKQNADKCKTRKMVWSKTYDASLRNQVFRVHEHELGVWFKGEKFQLNVSNHLMQIAIMANEIGVNALIWINEKLSACTELSGSQVYTSDHKKLVEYGWKTAIILELPYLVCTHRNCNILAWYFHVTYVFDIVTGQL